MVVLFSAILVIEQVLVQHRELFIDLVALLVCYLVDGLKDPVNLLNFFGYLVAALVAVAHLEYL